jgi:hypothetical protein
MDITFNERYMLKPKQLPVVATLWRMRVKKNIRKVEYKRLPLEEKQKLYLESRPTKQKLLDWAGSKSRALVRTVGTVDAWAGPAAKHTIQYARIGGNEPKLLGSGPARAGMSERAKQLIAVGIVIIMGGLTALLAVEKTKLEGSEPSTESEPMRVIPDMQEEMDKGPGVFLWGSNR